MPANTWVITRPSALGNPFQVYQVYKDFFAVQISVRAKEKVSEIFNSDLKGKSFDTKEEATKAAVDAYRRYATEDEGFNHLVRSMRGRNVACYCKVFDKSGRRVPCHGDVILSLANGIRIEDFADENT